MLKHYTQPTSLLVSEQLIIVPKLLNEDSQDTVSNWSNANGMAANILLLAEVRTTLTHYFCLLRKKEWIIYHLFLILSHPNYEMPAFLFNKE